MKKVFNLIIKCISLQLVHCNESFFTLLNKKSDKRKSCVNNLNIYNTTEVKSFLFKLKKKKKLGIY